MRNRRRSAKQMAVIATTVAARAFNGRNAGRRAVPGERPSSNQSVDDEATQEIVVCPRLFCHLPPNRRL